MHAYRNYYCDIYTNKNWCKLVELGLAKQNVMVDENGITYFHLTDEAEDMEIETEIKNDNAKE